MRSNGWTAKAIFWMDEVERINGLLKFPNGWGQTDERLIKIFEWMNGQWMEFRLAAVWKSFERNLHSFERPGSSVKKRICIPFEKLDHLFSRNVQLTFEWLINIIIRCIFSFLSIGRESTMWPANNCLQIMVCSCIVASKCGLLQIIFCSCAIGTRFSRKKNGRSLPWAARKWLK